MRGVADLQSGSFSNKSDSFRNRPGSGSNQPGNFNSAFARMLRCTSLLPP